MITYLINFILCSGVLLLVYRVFLRNENLYKFNRFYLLFSLVFSLVVPLVTIHVYPAETALVAHINQPAVIQNFSAAMAPAVVADSPAQQPVIQAPVHNYLPDVLPMLYSIVAIVMLLRFTRNLYTISRTVSKSAVRSINNAKLVLVDDDVTPHSFLNYVFINKYEYNNGQIAPEIICHEQTHVRQLHSLDVIAVELLQAVCWFNPLIPFYRRAIQLNHEFLADETVVKNYDNTPAYQCLLLSKAGQYSSLYLTSQFNYLTTKKRLIMMTKTTSAATAWFARLAIIPVVTIAFLLFCNKTAAELAPVKKTELFKTPEMLKTNDSVKKKKPFDLVKFRNDYPSTKKGAPPELLKEYAAIVARYADDQKYPANSKLGPALSPTDRGRLEEIFKQMNKKQQEQQKIGFQKSEWTLPEVIPTQAQLDSCNNNKLYQCGLTPNALTYRN